MKAQTIIIKCLSCIMLLTACGGDKLPGSTENGEVSVEKQNLDSGFDGEPGQTATVIDSSQKTLRAGPTKEFLQLVAEIEGMDWVGDTGRLQDVAIYSELNRDSVILFDGKPFYPLVASKSLILTYRGYSDLNEDGADETDRWDTTGISTLNETTSAWAYFYREKGAGGMIPDGIIEQWEFSESAAALKVYSILTRVRPLPYFNTIPHYHVVGRHLFVFHARAMAFSYDQLEVFERFKQISRSDKTKKG